MEITKVLGTSVVSVYSAATDHAAVQLDIADEQTGRITGKTSTYDLIGSVPMMVVADDSIARLATSDEFINKGYFIKDTK
ncbi:unnamed protein product [Rotaria magnacalcarata]|uniref:Uncharacterized protein n=2 Tax=Rotaria TaxID=231623 RepID=A0A815U504_9BILA|nr:unnamed protein product [Rotaria magnacalcarata]CAF3637736.1 unnamed protein product [Rotaria socialis]CAF1543728.1 unnamed protein product [Rotaria magnacalcarata]CAF2114990.1 unnamed protein product [Rotaria magnacalcarata]CAF3779518.1 unnamed protein product [Rotaria magnacalcarata]